MSPWTRRVGIALASAVSAALAVWLVPGIAAQAVPAQQAPPTQQTTAQQPAPPPQPRTDVKLVVECVLDEHDNCSTTATIKLRHELTLRVSNLAEWTAQHNSPWDLILYLNGQPFPGLHPISIDSQKNELTFRLKRTSETAATWNDLMTRQNNWKLKGILQEVQPSVGLTAGTASQTKATCELVFLSWVWVLVCFGFALCTLVALLVLSRRTALLRNGADGPFSLARTQMAIWTWLIINSYFALYVMTWDPGVDIPVSVLGLLGISTGTSLAAGLVDQASGGTQGPASKGFWKDITGGDSISLHRMQLIAWTVVLVFVFVVQVVTKLTIPDFNPTLLGLLGLSAGTYVGFKFPENQKSSMVQTFTNPQPPTTPPPSPTIPTAPPGPRV
jgi:hypothetical protein